MTRLVGALEIAALLGVRPETVHTWRYRRLLPEPLATVSGTPVWREDTIVEWARETGREKEQVD